MFKKTCDNHTVEFPVINSGLTSIVVKGKRLEFRPDQAQSEATDAGIVVTYFDKCHNPTHRNIYPWHTIDLFSEDIITKEDDAKYDEWYASAHAGMTPEEEADSTARAIFGELFGRDYNDRA